MINKKIFSRVVNLFLAHVKERRAESTYRRYESIVNKYLLPIFSDLKITKITRKQIVLFFNSLTERKIKRNTILGILNVFRCIYRYADDYLGFRVNLSVFSEINITKTKNIINVLSIEEINRITEYLVNNFSLKGISVLIALGCGLRLGEICALRWNDIDISNKVIKVRQTVQRLKGDNGRTRLVYSEPKTVNSKREVPIPKFLLVVLRKIKKEGKCFLLSGNERAVEPRRVQYYFNSISEEAIGKKVKFHYLRHTYATTLLRNKVEVKAVSAVLGHASVRTTLDFYRSITNMDLEEVGKTVNRCCFDKIRKKVSEIFLIYDTFRVSCSV